MGSIQAVAATVVLLAPMSRIPMSCCCHRQHTLRIPTGDIQDPVKRDLEKSQREREQLMPTRLRSPPVAGKETLNTVLWDKLESTPHGHHMDRDGNYVTKALTPEELLLRRSDVVFDDYNVATGDHAAAQSCWSQAMLGLRAHDLCPAAWRFCGISRPRSLQSPTTCSSTACLP